MAREIEVKIRLDDPTVFRTSLAQLAVAEGAYRKNDIYFQGPAGSIRLRESGGKSVVCRKVKTITNRMEINREIEFEVDDSLAFRRFAIELGYQEWYQKRKDGRAWRCGDVLIEEGTVSDLGWFAEFEILLDDTADEKSVDGALKTLEGLLDALGVDPGAIEARTYAQLLGHREA